MMPGKKVWGGIRHVLVDTQGNLVAVKVTGAEQSDQQGAKHLLLPLRKALPRMQLLWGDSHYGGTFVNWLTEHLGWKMQTVLRAKIPTRGLLVAEGEEPDWEARFPTGFVPLRRRMGGGANLLVDLPMASLGS
jgi:hypothetical protein